MGKATIKRRAKLMAAEYVRSAKGSRHMGISAYNYGIDDKDIPALLDEMRKLPELSGVKLSHEGIMGYITFIVPEEISRI